MNILIAVGAVNSLYIAILVLAKRDRSIGDWVLSPYLALVGICFALVYVAFEYDQMALLLVLVFSNLLFAPLFFCYVIAMVESRLRPRLLWHFVPLVFSMLYLLDTLWRLSEEEITLLFEVQGFLERPLLFNTFTLLDLVAPPLYLGLSWRKLKRHQHNVAERFSSLEAVDYRWLEQFVIAVALVWAVIDLPLHGSVFFEGLTTRQILVAGCSLATLMVLYIGIHGIRQRPVQVAPVAATPDRDMAQPRYARSGLAEEELQHHTRRLLAVFETEQLHLSSSLTIRELAQALGLSEHNTSQVINVGLGTSFFDLVNGYRVEEFKRRVRLEENAHRTLLAVALECGFSSKSSFNRIFKQRTGMTPSAHVKPGSFVAPVPADATGDVVADTQRDRHDDQGHRRGQ